MATSRMVAQTQGRRHEGAALVAADSRTGAKVGTISWRYDDFSLWYDDWWLDDETMLIATAPYFLGWRPRTGQVFRVTDAHMVVGDYWDLTYAPNARSR